MIMELNRTQPELKKIVVRSLNGFLDWQCYSCSGKVTLNDQF